MIEFAQPAALWTALAVGLPFWLIWLIDRLPASIRFHPFASSVRQGFPDREKKPPIFFAFASDTFVSRPVRFVGDPYWMPESTPDTRGNQERKPFLPSRQSEYGRVGGLEEARILLCLIDEETELGLVAFGQNILAEWKPGRQKELTEGRGLEP